MSQAKKIIVTSALPYANGPIHVGHLVEYIQTDIFVRFLKLIGKEAIYCCADDTHGTPVEIAALKEGILPEELINRIHEEHVRDFKRFHIHFDSYYSTNSKENKYFSDLVFQRLKKKGCIYQKEVQLAYCNKCKRFLPDRYVKGRCPKCNADDQYGDVCEQCNAAYKTTDLVSPYCTICGSSPTRKFSRHYFFRLGMFAEKLKTWLSRNKNLQSEVVNYVMNWIMQGLDDWDISRDGPYFGFKIPGEDDMYYYVWLDAPIGYIASLCNALDKDINKTEQQWNNSEIIHFIGKDITYFHFLFWPAMLMASELALPSYIVVHGYLTVDGEKMSKSRGTFITAEEFSNKYPPEYLRYYYAKFLSKKLSDIDLNFKDFVTTINNELVANLGNFCYRTLNFLEKNFNGVVKEIQTDKKLQEEIEKRIDNIEGCYKDVNLNEAIKGILAISSMGNKYFQENEPWKLIKEEKGKTHKILGFCVNIVKNLSILIRPILPYFADELQSQLNLRHLRWKDLDFNLKNHSIHTTKILLQKLQEVEEEEFPLSIKVAQVTKIENHPKADKLYIMQVDLGTEKRQIVAGIKPFFKKEELLKKKILVLTNLKPAKLRGIESNGMLLAADIDGVPRPLTFDKSPVGSTVHVEGCRNNTRQITYEEFSKTALTTKGCKVVWNNKVLMTDMEEVTAPNAKDGAEIK